MNDAHYTALTDRGILSISGSDSLAFLQGIVTNDMEKVTPNCTIYAAILTPQGKYLHDFFVIKFGDSFLLDCSANQLDELTKRLKMYRLRSKVDIKDQSADFAVISITDAKTCNDIGLTDAPGNAIDYDDGIAFVDPRLVELGARAILPAVCAAEFLQSTDLATQNLEGYKALQLELGIPDGSDGEMLKQVFPLEIGFEELNAVSFDKGCYVGQEVTTRMKIRKLVKKRLLPITFDGISPIQGSNVLNQNKISGQIFSVGNNAGLAMIRLETLDQVLSEGIELAAGESTLRATKPAWFKTQD